MKRFLAGVYALVLTAVPLSFGTATAQTLPGPTATMNLLSQSPWNSADRPLEVSFRATNISATPLDDLSVELIVGAPATSRSLYQLSLTEDSAPLVAFPLPQGGTLTPGESRTFRIRQRMDVLASRADNGLYPLKLELRSHDQAVAALRTPMIFLIERPRVPLNLAWTWVLSEPLQFRADGTFLPGTLEADIASGGRLSTIVDALARLENRDVDVVISPLLVEQLQRMSKGYRILGADGIIRTVAAGAGGAADAAVLLRSLREVASHPRTELLASPFPDPSLPALFRAGLAGELPTLVERGGDLLADALGRKPTTDLIRPLDSQLDAATLPRLVSMGVRAVLVDPGFVSALKFQSPPVVRLTAGRSSLAAILPNSELAVLAQDYRADPTLAAHVALGELAAIWLELPGTAGRGAAVLLGEDSGLLPPFFTLFASLVRSSSWLRPVTATGFLSTIAGQPRRQVPPRAYPSFGLIYLNKLLHLRSSLSRFRETVDGSAEVEVRLRGDLLLAQSEAALTDPSLGQSFIDAVSGEIRHTYDRVHIATTVVTLPSQRGLVPLTIANESGQRLRAVLQFVTDRRLQFVGGSSRGVVLDPGTRTLTFSVQAQATGRIPVRVQVLSAGEAPDTIASRTMVIRSTAYNRLALFLTVGAAVFLLGWWGRRFLPRRRS
ncbi:MAG: hypothetical protein E6G44_05935 [Actinobacteria bacterium]|nr:MAG: hypothetical protein E6G44_05935 [Actinomycetota bacterium]